MVLVFNLPFFPKAVIRGALYFCTSLTFPPLFYLNPYSISQANYEKSVFMAADSLIDLRMLR